MASSHASERNSYDALLAELESLTPDAAESILTHLAAAIFPAGFGSLDQVTFEKDDVSPAGRPATQDPRAIDEAKLRAAELRYRTLVEQIPAVTFMAALGEGENEVYVSPHIEQLLGFTQQEWLENPFLWYTQLHPDDRALWHAEFARGCRTGGPFRAECRFIARDGRVVWVRGEARLVKDKLGRPLFLQGVAFDITESKRTQEMVVREAVRTTEERYRDLVEGLGAIFWEADPATGAFTFVSRGASEILGFPPERWIGEPNFWHGVVHPDDRGRVEEAWHTALTEGRDHEFEFRAIRADQRAAWLHAKVHFPDGAEGAKPVGVILDISDRKRAEEELARVFSAEQLARREAEALNRVGRSIAAELDVNQLVNQITDVCIQLTGAEWSGFVRLDDDSEHRAINIRTADGRLTAAAAAVPSDDPLLEATFAGSTILTDDLGRHFQGSRQTHLPKTLGLRSYLGVPIISRSGRVIGGLFCGHSRPAQFTKEDARIIEGFAVQAAIAVDNAHLYAAAERARRAAEAANRAKDEFLATMSHELRTPLNAVLGWLQVLRSGGASSQGTRERALTTIERNARAQAQIINDLLDVSRIVTGKLQLATEPVDLAAVVDAAVEGVALAANAKQISLTKRVAPTARVLGDADRLRQVVTNLLTNAVKFTPHGGRIDILLEADGHLARLRVADNGQGIEPALVPQVFDRFFQADSSTTRVHGGLGLGLAIVRHIVEMHGGRVRADSPGLNLGATFTVEIPLLTPETARAHAAASGTRREIADAARALAGASVLVVDDEPDSRDVVVDLLQSVDADVAAAASVADALRLLERRSVDVVVCDIGMPGEDGFEFLRRLRASGERHEEIPVVALTAYAREQDRARVLAAGFRAHLAKPFDAAELLAALADAIEERPRAHRGR